MSQYLINLRLWQQKPLGAQRKLSYALTDQMIDFIENLENALKESELQNGLLKIELENQARLLNSCETALRERDGL